MNGNIFRLFFGDNSFNKDPLNIISIGIIAQRSNLKTQVAALTVLDGIISDSLYGNKIKKGSQYGGIIKALFESNGGKQKKLNPYIYDTFQCFIDHKEKMEINMMTLDEYIKDKQLLDLIANDLMEIKDKSDISLWISERKENLIKSRLFEIFENVNEIRIDVGLNRYPFSLLSFLSNIENSSIKKVTIMSYIAFKPLSLSSSFNEIRKKYKEKKYDIKIGGSSLTIESHKRV